MISKSTKNRYLNEIHEQLDYFATWEPNLNLKLGDIGCLYGNYFDFYSNLKRRKIDFKSRDDSTPGNLKHVSKKFLKIKFKASGKKSPKKSSLAKADAGVIINFKRAAGIYFETYDTYTHLIKDQIALRDEIYKRFIQNKWDPSLVIITEIIEAKRAAIFISSSKRSSMELKAHGQFRMGSLNIADAEANFQVVSSKYMATNVMATKGIKPLFRVKGLLDENGRQIKTKKRGKEIKKLIEEGKIRFGSIKS